MKRSDWFKSSYSADNAQCVEVRLTGWFKSSHSANNAQCVEARFTADTIQVRDSKHPTGPLLSFPRNAWAKFLTRTT